MAEQQEMFTTAPGRRLGVLRGVSAADARHLRGQLVAETPAVAGDHTSPEGAAQALVLEAMHSAVLMSYETASASFAATEPVLDDSLFHQLDAERRLELVRAASRAATRAKAALLRHAVAMAEDPRFHFEDAHGRVNSASEEIGQALGVPAPTVGRWLKAGREIFGRLFPTGLAFESGELALEKALVIGEALERVPDALAFAVQDEILPQAPERTVRELKAEIARLLVELDVEHANERHREARSSRTVSRLMPEPDGMASFRVRLPADCAATVEEALTLAVGHARAEGDARTRSQVRADALSTWALDALSAGGSLALFDWPEAGVAEAPVPGSPRVLERMSIPPGRISVTVPLEVLAGAIPGWAPHPSPVARIAEEIMGAEPSSHPALDGRTEAAWLEGYGPIPSALARLLAAGGTWRRIVTDTVTGAPLDVGRASYTPPTAITEAVRLLDRTCSRPGCGMPASYADRDHVVEWADGGETSVANVALLCRRCHRLKSLGAGSLSARCATGERAWTSTLGTRTAKPQVRRPRVRIRTGDSGEDGSTDESPGF